MYISLSDELVKDCYLLDCDTLQLVPVFRVKFLAPFLLSKMEGSKFRRREHANFSTKFHGFSFKETVILMYAEMRS
jgi:hypothetical protein